MNQEGLIWLHQLHVHIKVVIQRLAITGQ